MGKIDYSEARKDNFYENIKENFNNNPNLIYPIYLYNLPYYI